MNKNFILLSLMVSFISNAQSLSASLLGRYTNGTANTCEISAYNKTEKLIYVLNGANNQIDIINVNSWATPVLVSNIPLATYGANVNSVVNINDQYFAVCIEANPKTANGKVVFFDKNGVYKSQVNVGAQPDMITISPNNQKILVANEGEPDNSMPAIDPNGSVSIIDISNGIETITQTQVTTLDFALAPAVISGSIKRNSETFAKDLEPEYITITPDNTRAIVSCQETNVFVIIDLTTNTIIDYMGLGFKNHSLTQNSLDPSDSDTSSNGGININTWPVKGVYQPDAIKSFVTGGNTYVLSANEGDSREWTNFNTLSRIKNLTLDATAFPTGATLKLDANLGRLNSFKPEVVGDTDGDGDIDELYCYGARSFSIWSVGINGSSKTLVWDSGNQFENFFATNHATHFNVNDGLISQKDKRSDDKGPEPEAITVGTIGAKNYAFIGLERQGGVLIYDITVPTTPTFVMHINSFTAIGMTDIAPEDIQFISSANSHSGQNIIVVSNEVSGTVAFYAISDTLFSNSVDFDNDVKIYPNPASEIITVSVKENTLYQLVTLDSKVVKVGDISLESNNIDVSNLSKGTYILHLNTNNGVKIISKKLIIN